MINIEYKDGTFSSMFICDKSLFSGEYDNIMSISVNGDELKKILRVYNNIPYPNGIINSHSSFAWYGDIAQMIIKNIDYIWDE